MSNLIAQIQCAFEQDQIRATQKVYAAGELPLNYDAITARWLTEVLCTRVPGAKVVEFDLAAVDTGTSNRRKIEVRYNEAGAVAGLPQALFCKASHELANRILLGLAGGAHSEVTFYNRIRPHLPIEAPTSFFADLDPHSFNSLIMLGDLSQDAKTEFCSHHTTMTRQRAESQIQLLALLHGSCYSSGPLKTELQAFPTWPDYFRGTLAFGMKEGSQQGFLESESVIPPGLFRRYDQIWPATLRSVERHSSLPHTLAHGDVHLKNWYVAGSGEMGLSDWQCAARAHWGRDFAYTIATALTVENRRTWERDLLALYLDRLRAAGGPTVDFNEAWKHYRQQLVTALTWWTLTLSPPPGLPNMQPRETTLEFICRIATAMDDVDSLESLGDYSL